MVSEIFEDIIQSNLLILQSVPVSIKVVLNSESTKEDDVLILKTFLNMESLKEDEVCLCFLCSWKMLKLQHQSTIFRRKILTFYKDNNPMYRNDK